MGMVRGFTTGQKVAVTLASAAVVGGVVALVADHLRAEAQQRQRMLEHLAAEERARQHVLAAVVHVASVLGVQLPVVRFDNCANAHANQERYEICFSLSWAMRAMNVSCADALCTWNRVLSVVGHEFGHLLDPYLAQRDHWDREYFADHTAGWVLGMLGASPADFEALLAEWTASETHPAGFDRIPYLRAGFNEALAACAAA